MQTTWEQVPRSANTVADRLAGDALKAAKLMLRRHDNPGSVCCVSLYDALFEVMPTAMTLVADLSDLFADQAPVRAWTGFHLRTSTDQLAQAEPIIILPEPEPQGGVHSIRGPSHCC